MNWPPLWVVIKQLRQENEELAKDIEKYEILPTSWAWTTKPVKEQIVRSRWDDTAKKWLL